MVYKKRNPPITWKLAQNRVESWGRINPDDYLSALRAAAENFPKEFLADDKMMSGFLTQLYSNDGVQYMMPSDLGNLGSKLPLQAFQNDYFVYALHLMVTSDDFLMRGSSVRLAAPIVEALKPLLIGGEVTVQTFCRSPFTKLLIDSAKHDEQGILHKAFTDLCQTTGIDAQVVREPSVHEFFRVAKATFPDHDYPFLDMDAYYEAIDHDDPQLVIDIASRDSTLMLIESRFVEGAILQPQVSGNLTNGL